jgi:hypothetical protein
MKKISSLLFASLVAGATMFSCSDLDNSFSPKGKNGSDSDLTLTATSSNHYTIEAGAPSYDGNTTTFTYTVSGTKPTLSHWNIELGECLGFENIIGATVNGADWMANLKTTDGSCASEFTNFVKFDDLSSAAVNVITLTVDMKVGTADAGTISKGGTICQPTTVAGPGCPIVDEVCTKDDTSWAGNVGVNVGSAGSWFYYIDLNQGSTTTLYAGQHHNVGTVSVASVGGSYEVTVTLASGVTLQSGDNWYMESYATAPSTRPVSGHMAYKGEESSTSFTKTISDNGNYVAVHVNVNRPIACN